jgi:formimidoylglutamate deiminase
MYGIALALEAEDVYDVSRFCFLEMLRTGVTAVGEFHYLHHQRDGKAYADPNELALRVSAAAEAVGLRIALLNVCYARGGIGEPLEDRQRRFRASSLDGFLERTERLHDLVSTAGGVRRPDERLVTVGVAPHSVRAVPRDWLPALRGWAVERDAPIHMHVSERPTEVAQCEREHGLRPVELLAEDGLLDERFTTVHATHLTDHEVRLLGDSAASVCACPTTERDLGDGFLRGLDLLHAGTPICLGTDSHTSLDFLAEMRLVEYHERLQRLERVTITDDTAGGAERLRVAPRLLEMATVAGARSLRLDAGRIAPGSLADLVALDLDHHSLAGWTDDTLAAMVTLSATPGIVRDVWVGGLRRLEDRTHSAEEEITARFEAVASAEI